MATEPERPIEKLLQACAKKRADEAGAPFELHPATRRLLQGEVTRTLAKEPPKSESQFGFLLRLWPRVAWGAAIFAVLAAAVWIMVPGSGRESRRFDLAKNEALSSAAPGKQTPESAPPPTSAVEPLPPAANQPSRLDLDSAALSKDKSLDQLGLANQPIALPAASVMEEKKAQSPAVAVGGAQEREMSRTLSAAQTAADSMTPEPAEAFRRRYGLAPAQAAPAPAPAAPAVPIERPSVPASPPAVTLADSAAAAKTSETERISRTSKAEVPAPSLAPAPGLSGATLKLSKDMLGDSVNQSANRINSQGTTQVQRFARAPAQSDGLLEARRSRAEPSANAASPQVVLMSFRVEQRDRELRIIDGDGSVYSGYVQPAVENDVLRAGTIAKPAAARALRTPADQATSSAAPITRTELSSGNDYSFRVTGTNRTLHKQVIFSGMLTAVTNSASFRMQALTNSLGTAIVAADRAQNQPLVKARIAGKLSIGGGKEVDVQAVPANP